jgi:hypothetical protein
VLHLPACLLCLNSRSRSGAAAAAALPAVPPESIASLALVMLVSEHRVQKLALSYPQVGANRAQVGIRTMCQQLR